jgi:hypothetical protein
MRRSESRVWSTLGATGAIYALRRKCWTPLPAGTLLDDVLEPMRAVLNGGRIVFDRARRRLRPVVGGRRREATAQDANPGRQLPDPGAGAAAAAARRQSGVAAVRVAQSRRLLVPWALVGLFASSLALARGNSLFAVPPLCPGDLLRPGARRAVFERSARFGRIAFTFVMMNVSAVAGLAALRRGREVWR